MPRLTYLDISNNKLTGTLPHSIANLSKVWGFLVRDNKMHGTIPDEIGDMSALAYAHLSLNSFNGTIPTTLYKLTNMYYLSLRCNFFSGTIPAYLGDFTLFQQLSLYNNSLTGTIPNTLTKLKKLSILLLHQNRLNGECLVDSLKYVSFLRNFVLLSGTIPEGLGKLPLISFYLSDNSISGTISNSFCHLNKTAFGVSMYSNYLNGTLPKCFSSFTALKYLEFNDNMLTGELFDDFSKLPLSSLNLENNNFGGVLPKSIASLSKLVTFSVRNNNFEGSIDMFHDMPNWPYCTRFDVSGNKLTGDLNYSNIFKGLVSARCIDLGSNCISGSLPSTICSLTKLQSLSLNGLASNCDNNKWNPLGLFKTPIYKSSTGSMLSCLWEMPQLTNLYLSGNLISGSLSSVALSNSSLLSSVSLSSNYFTGDLSPDLQRAPFESLDLRYLLIFCILHFLFFCLNINYFIATTV